MQRQLVGKRRRRRSLFFAPLCEFFSFKIIKKEQNKAKKKLYLLKYVFMKKKLK
jgi:hypothetical protein